MFERFTKAAKVAVVTAQEEARELCAPAIEVEHLLLGVITGPDEALVDILAGRGITVESVRENLTRKTSSDPLGTDDAEALNSIGIDLDAVRENLNAAFGDDALECAIAADEPHRRGRPHAAGRDMSHIPFAKDAKKTLKLSLHECTGRGERRIEAGHILLAILREPNTTSRRVLGDDESIRQLRVAVSELLDRAA